MPCHPHELMAKDNSSVYVSVASTDLSFAVRSYVLDCHQVALEPTSSPACCCLCKDRKLPYPPRRLMRLQRQIPASLGKAEMNALLLSAGVDGERLLFVGIR